MLGCTQSGAVQLKRSGCHRLKLHLGLPFINVRVRLKQNTAQKFVASELNQPRLGFDELRGAKTL